MAIATPSPTLAGAGEKADRRRKAAPGGPPERGRTMMESMAEVGRTPSERHKKSSTS